MGKCGGIFQSTKPCLNHDQRVLAAEVRPGSSDERLVRSILDPVTKHHDLRQALVERQRGTRAATCPGPGADQGTVMNVTGDWETTHMASGYREGAAGGTAATPEHFGSEPVPSAAPACILCGHVGGVCHQMSPRRHRIVNATRARLVPGTNVNAARSSSAPFAPWRYRGGTVGGTVATSEPSGIRARLRRPLHDHPRRKCRRCCHLRMTPRQPHRERHSRAIPGSRPRRANTEQTPPRVPALHRNPSNRLHLLGDHDAVLSNYQPSAALWTQLIKGSDADRHR